MIRYFYNLWGNQIGKYVSYSLFISLWYKIGHNFLIIKLKQFHPYLASLAESAAFLLGKLFQGAPGPFPQVIGQLPPVRREGDPFRWLIFPPEAAVAQGSMWCHHGNPDHPDLGLTLKRNLIWIALFLSDIHGLNSVFCQACQWMFAIDIK